MGLEVARAVERAARAWTPPDWAAGAKPPVEPTGLRTDRYAAPPNGR